MEMEDTVIARVEVSPNDEPVISLEQEVQLQVTAENSTGVEVPSGAVTWSTSDQSVLAITNTGLMAGVSSGAATITATAGGRTGKIDIHVVDLTGEWIGGEEPDTVRYTLMQTGTMVEGVFQSHLGFPPITDVNTGILTGSLDFGRYFHDLELTTEDDCQLRISGEHIVEVTNGGELILRPGSGTLSSSNCTISGTIDFATLRRK